MTEFVDAVRTYLELAAPSQLKRAPFTDLTARVVRRDEMVPGAFLEIYRAVGWKWGWRDRLFWPAERLAAHLASADISVWECVVGDDMAGFFELQRHDDGSVEIAYFGIVDAFMGRGIGKALLSRAAEEAWALGATRVWLHTCTFDSPRALPNYVARGFRVVRTETYKHRVPDDLLPASGRH
ncbi:MAG TPA: GNAT family N-acetyltransferase [Gemmatimonadaceae bacterium]|nr:GNAT family N-acetyltransferase [Gemmatimonadaceae bacterium]